MPLKSDIVIDAAKFQPSAILEQTTKLNQHLVEILAPAPQWYEVREALEKPTLPLLQLGL
jgi:hypothetical protein